LTNASTLSPYCSLATGESTIYAFAWRSNSNFIAYDGSNTLLGVRPIIKLSASVYVIDGNGTYASPYTIGNV